MNHNNQLRAILSPMRRLLGPLLLGLLFVTGAQAAEEQVINGTLENPGDSQEFTVFLSEGQVLLAQTEDVSDTLDPTLTLYNAETGSFIMKNDDYGWDTTQSALRYRVPESGDYSVVLSDVDQGTGDFSIRLVSGGGEVMDEPINRVTLSGTTLSHETEHFVVHYSLEGADATTEDYMNTVADSLETAWNVQINDLGWAVPPPDVLDNDPRYDVYLASIKDREQDVVGFTWPEVEIGDNPNTRRVETNAASSYIVLENDLAEQGFLDEDKLREYMIGTVAHEFNHAVQAGYDDHDPLSWIYEATAAWMEAVTFDDYASSLEYLPNVFYTPEVCLGAKSAYEAQGLDYGRWLLLYTLADRFGQQSIKELWQNVAEYDGYESLDRMLASYDSSIPDALANYHARTLARDFPFADDFNDTVWSANTITGDGDWTTLDEGIQELGAGFFYFKRPPGLYQVHLSDEGGAFEVWAINVGADEVQAIPLGRGGTFSTEGAKYSYLMVFNSLVNKDPEDCHFYSFNLNVGKGSGTPAEARYTFDASHFIQPELR